MFRTRGISLYIFLGLLVLAGMVYFIFDPSEASWMPKCFVHYLTGLDCPGCGAQRAVHALLHGDIAGSFRANALLVILLPYLILLFVAETGRTRYAGLAKIYRRLSAPSVITVILCTVIAWTILRNIL